MHPQRLRADGAGAVAQEQAFSPLSPLHVIYEQPFLQREATTSSNIYTTGVNIKYQHVA